MVSSCMFYYLVRKPQMILYHSGIFTPGVPSVQETFMTGHFARDVMYEREHVSFMTRDEFNAILSYLCTE